ncbi:DNA repair protein [Actinobacillus equuli]|nr:DNA repair protein [Actinobacillus equuli]
MSGALCDTLTAGSKLRSSAFQCTKVCGNNQTETQMSLLTQAERVQALARLLGGSKITDAVLANAQEMLDLVE